MAGLSVGDRVRDVSFSLRRGEILGVTGLLGAGQNELARALFGIAPGVTGTIRRRGRVCGSAPQPRRSRGHLSTDREPQAGGTLSRSERRRT